jgi:glucose-1-phosphate thymidylyltransferase
MWGIIPAAGAGSRMQPLAFSKELLPVGSRATDHAEQPRAVSEYIIERMAIAGVTKICFVVAPDKLDILEYYGGSAGAGDLFYAVQPKPAGLCDAIFRALPLIPAGEAVIIGLPDTVWFPDDALRALADDEFSFLLFPVARPELFDVVLTDEQDAVRQIDVKQAAPRSNWIWGALKMPGAVFAELHRLWSLERAASDVYIGTLVNAYLAAGGRARAVRSGRAYFDVGTLDGYRQAMRLLSVCPEVPTEVTPEAAK